jgi:hypothetical protein
MYERILEQIRQKTTTGELKNFCESVGIKGPSCLALPGSTNSNVICPQGFRPSLHSSVCCVPITSGEARNSYAATIDENEPPTKQQKNLQGNPIPRGQFGKMYRTIRPNADETKINKKYNKYLSLF